jgi:chaperonin cofactor prefoldin
MNKHIKAWLAPLTPDQLAQRQLLKAQIDLLEAQRMQEMWEAQVRCYEKTIERLEKLGYNTPVYKGEAALINFGAQL